MIVPLLLTVLVSAPPPAPRSLPGAPGAELSASTSGYATIVVYTESWCGPCQKWKRECESALKEAGWSIEKRPSGGRTIPHFVVSVGDKQTEWTGYSSRAAFMHRLRAFIEGKRQTVKRGYGRGQWTWPGHPSVAELEEHLAEPPHNYDAGRLRAMTDQELLDMHDQWHNARRQQPTRRTRFIRRGR